MHRVHQDGFFEVIIDNQPEIFSYRLAITCLAWPAGGSKPAKLRIRTAIHPF